MALNYTLLSKKAPSHMFDRILFKFLKAFKNSFYTLQLCSLSDLH